MSNPESPNPNPESPMSNPESPNPAANPNPNPKSSMSNPESPNPAANPNPKNEPVMVPYLLDVSHLGMINLLNAKKAGTILVKDPAINQRIYSQTPWLLTENRLPTIPVTREHLFYSSRSLQEGSDKNIQRQLDGLGVNDVLHYKSNNGVTPVYDPETCSIVGRVRYFTLKFSGYDDKGKDISTNWHLVEYESFEGDPMMTLCKLRLESKAVKDAMAEVAKMASKVKDAVLAADKEMCRLKVNDLPDENKYVRAIVEANDHLIAAELSVDDILKVLNAQNLKNYEEIVGPRQVRADERALLRGGLLPPPLLLLVLILLSGGLVRCMKLLLMHLQLVKGMQTDTTVKGCMKEDIDGWIKE